MKEIGSEFWSTEPQNCNVEYLLSGRTALDYIIRDILKTQKIDSVMLPSYCCHTMIEPFLANGINVRFYDVYFDAERGLCVDIPEALENEIFYYMTYFGFAKIWGIDFKKIKSTYSVVIDDRTHSCMSENQNDDCDYYFESYRKWAGFGGIAKASKTHGSFQAPCTEINETYVALRKQAFALKQRYIQTGEGDKEKFLSLFCEAETLLETDYRGYRAPDVCLRELCAFDRDTLQKKRRINAAILFEALKEVKEIKLLFDILEEGDTPLFVPILAGKHRDKLRRYLIEKKIYCPVHWPVSDCHRDISERARELYQSELSIPCDQRYDTNDMCRIARVIKEFYISEGFS